MSQAETRATERLSSPERTALQLVASSPKPWNGAQAGALATTSYVLQKLVDRGLLRGPMDADKPLVVEGTTLLWITPSGRGALGGSARD